MVLLPLVRVLRPLPGSVRLRSQAMLVEMDHPWLQQLASVKVGLSWRHHFLPHHLLVP